MLEIDDLLRLSLGPLEQLIRFLSGFLQDPLGLLFGERARHVGGCSTVRFCTGHNRIGCSGSFREDCFRSLSGSCSCLSEDGCGLLLGVGNDLGSFSFALGSESFELCDHRFPLGLEESNPIIEFCRLRLEIPALALGSGDHIGGSLLRFGQELFGCLRNLGVATWIWGERCSQFVGESLHIGRQPVTVGFEFGNPILLTVPLSGKDGLSLALCRFNDGIGLLLRLLDERRSVDGALLQLCGEAIACSFEFGNAFLVTNPLSGELDFCLLLSLVGQHSTIDCKLFQLRRQAIALSLEFGDPLLLTAPVNSRNALGFESSGSNDLIGLPLRIFDHGVAVAGGKRLLSDSIGFTLDGGSPVARFGLDLRSLLAGATEHSIFRIEDGDHGAVHRLAFRRSALLGLELCLLEPGLRLLGPVLELAKVRLQFTEEVFDFALVVALPGRGELACVYGLWEVGGFLAHDRVIGQPPRHLDGETSQLRTPPFLGLHEQTGRP